MRVSNQWNIAESSKSAATASSIDDGAMHCAGGETTTAAAIGTVAQARAAQWARWTDAAGRERGAGDRQRSQRRDDLDHGGRPRKML